MMPNGNHDEDATHARLARLEARDRDHDELAGRYLSTDAAVTAVTNGFRELAALVQTNEAARQRDRDETRAELAALKRAVERALAVPLALVAWQVLGESGASSSVTIGGTVAALALAALSPELAARLVRRHPAVAALDSTPPAAPPVRVERPQ